jgi:hypothetical protein
MPTPRNRTEVEEGNNINDKGKRSWSLWHTLVIPGKRIDSLRPALIICHDPFQKNKSTKQKQIS